MCLLVVLSRVLPDAPLVVAANRDERTDRPAEAMAVLRDTPPRALGGRDLVAGGTWLAVNERGVVAGLTNRPLPDGADSTKRSRGELPLALVAHPSASSAARAFTQEQRPADYNPAWLLVGDRESLVAIDMTGSAVDVWELGPGVHILENGPLHAPSAKVEHLRGLVAGIEAMTTADAVDRLAGVLADHDIPAPSPTDAAHWSDYPAAIRAACVHTEDATFGTRWSGIVTVTGDATAPPAFRYTDGPPCRTPFEDAAVRWG